MVTTSIKKELPPGSGGGGGAGIPERQSIRQLVSTYVRTISCINGNKIIKSQQFCESHKETVSLPKRQHGVKNNALVKGWITIDAHWNSYLHVCFSWTNCSGCPSFTYFSVYSYVYFVFWYTAISCMLFITYRVQLLSSQLPAPGGGGGGGGGGACSAAAAAASLMLSMTSSETSTVAASFFTTFCLLRHANMNNE